MAKKAREEILRWYEARVGKFTAERRAIALEGVRDFTAEDWEAYYTLHTRYAIETRTPEERSELEREEQKILRLLPKVHVMGSIYNAPWSWGVRVAAARKLWGDVDFSRATIVPL